MMWDNSTASRSRIANACLLTVSASIFQDVTFNVTSFSVLKANAITSAIVVLSGIQEANHLYY